MSVSSTKESHNVGDGTSKTGAVTRRRVTAMLCGLGAKALLYAGKAIRRLSGTKRKLVIGATTAETEAGLDRPEKKLRVADHRHAPPQARVAKSSLAMGPRKAFPPSKHDSDIAPGNAVVRYRLMFERGPPKFATHQAPRDDHMPFVEEVCKFLLIKDLALIVARFSSLREFAFDQSGPDDFFLRVVFRCDTVFLGLAALVEPPTPEKKTQPPSESDSESETPSESDSESESPSESDSESETGPQSQSSSKEKLPPPKHPKFHIGHGDVDRTANANAFVQFVDEKGCVPLDVAGRALHHMLVSSGPINWILLAVSVIEYYYETYPQTTRRFKSLLCINVPLQLERIVELNLLDRCSKLFRPHDMPVCKKVSGSCLLAVVQNNCPAFLEVVSGSRSVIAARAFAEGHPQVVQELVLSRCVDTQFYVHLMNSIAEQERVSPVAAVVFVRGRWGLASDGIFWRVFQKCCDALDEKDVLEAIQSREAAFLLGSKKRFVTDFFWMMALLIKAHKYKSVEILQDKLGLRGLDFVNAIGTGPKRKLAVCVFEMPPRVIEYLCHLLPEIKSQLTALLERCEWHSGPRSQTAIKYLRDRFKINTAADYSHEYR